MPAAGRKQYAGAAVQTTLAALLTNSALSFTINSATGWPDGSVGQFVVEVDPGSGNPTEKILCDSRSGTTVTVNATGRGHDGTAAVQHANGAVVKHIWDAASATDFARHIYVTTDDDHPQYLLTAEGDARYPTLASLAAKGYLWTASAAGVLVPLAPGADFTRLQSRAGAANGIEWAALGSGARVDTSESTTSTSYTDLATAGPAVTLTTGTSVLVLLSTFAKASVAGSTAYMGVAVSGAGVVAASDVYAAGIDSTNQLSIMRGVVLAGLTPGSNTFTAKYRSVSGASTAFFASRAITILPL